MQHPGSTIGVLGAQTGRVWHDIDVAGDTILVVEDNPDVRNMLAMRLEFSHYVVRVAATGAEALEFMDSHPDDVPSLVIADVVMPEMDGIQFCTAVRSRPRYQETPLVFFSGLPEDDPRVVEMMEQPCVWHVTKGGRVEQIVELIKGLLDGAGNGSAGKAAGTEGAAGQLHLFRHP